MCWTPSQPLPLVPSFPLLSSPFLSFPTAGTERNGKRKGTWKHKKRHGNGTFAYSSTTMAMAMARKRGASTPVVSPVEKHRRGRTGVAPSSRRRRRCAVGESRGGENHVVGKKHRKRGASTPVVSPVERTGEGGQESRPRCARTRAIGGKDSGWSRRRGASGSLRWRPGQHKGSASTPAMSSCMP